MIKGLNISKKYKKFELQPTSIEIDKGEIVALIGENGAGKSTLIKCMCGVIDADEGQLEVDGQVVKKLDDVLVLGFMNQDQNVYNEIKIRDLTNFVKDVMKKKFDQEVYYYYFKDVFQLDEDYKMKELSTGMKVKYFLSLELAKNPDLLVLDEPTSGLDPIVRDEVLDILRCVAKEKNTSVLFSSHITEDIEKIADRVIFINNGRIVLQGDKKDIIFTKKWILLSVVYAVVATWLIMHEGATNILFTFFLVPFFVTSLPFTKIMSIEDNSDTRDFIRRLPVSKYLVVFSRAVFILFMLLISSISLFVIQTIGFNVEYNTDMLIKIASIILIFLLYFMLQLGVFYKYSYHASQSILVIISFAVIVLGFITENIDLVKYFKNFDWSILLFIMAIINVVVYFIDTKLYAGK